MLARGIIGAIEPSSIEPSLRGAEIQRAGRKRPENLNAYDLYLRALPHALCLHLRRTNLSNRIA
jgi:hypothetical protein